MLQSSMRISSLATAQTASKITSVSGDTLLTTSATAFGFDRTAGVENVKKVDTSIAKVKIDVPVDVSTWVIVTILYFLACNAFSTSSRLTVVPNSALI